ncbi:MAG: TrmH family RNA methyltransferase [Klebsiella pneumoniae]|nr:TrmH family RNA methyltransferase [Klebsiella pneumoniae]
MRLTIILVGPARAENVGAAARAMKTMGFRELRIVDSEAHLAPPARWVAHGSGDILDGITTYPTLAEALHDVDFTVATTARSRAADYPSLNLGQSVMVYCYQLASLMQQTAPAAAAADHHQLQALRTRTLALLSRLGVEDDAKLADWLSQRLGLLQQRDTAMLHRLLHDIEKNLPE